jgi:hypothetical protein
MSKARDIADRKLDGVDLELGDDDKAVFGDGSDLQIYHESTSGYSIIKEAGQGNLLLTTNGAEVQILGQGGGEYSARFIQDGAVNLYYDGAKKVVTTSTGVDVTGTVTADGLTVGDGVGNETNTILFNSASGGTAKIESVTRGAAWQDLHFYNTYATEKKRLSITNDGDISFYEDTGTTAKFFWDASAESLTIGSTINSSIPLNVSAATSVAGTAIAFLRNTGSSGNGLVVDTTAPQDYIADFRISNSSKMRIDSSGNVGIGTGSPAGELHVAATYHPEFRLESTVGGGTARLVGGSSYGQLVIDADVDNEVSGSYLSMRVDGSEAMRIDSDGNLFVGTTDTSLYANSSGEGFSFINNEIGVAADSKSCAYFNRMGSDGDTIKFFKSGTAVGKISVTGSSTSYVTSSDYRLKEDWQPMANASNRVSALKPVNFAWKADGKRVDGFLAHELAEVVPEAVTGEKDAMRTEEYEVTPAVLDDEGNVVTEAVMGTREVPDYQGIDQSKLVPLLTAALQEAIAKIETLEARLDAANL